MNNINRREEQISWLDKWPGRKWWFHPGPCTVPQSSFHVSAARPLGFWRSDVSRILPNSCEAVSKRQLLLNIKEPTWKQTLVPLWKGPTLCCICSFYRGTKERREQRQEIKRRPWRLQRQFEETLVDWVARRSNAKLAEVKCPMWKPKKKTKNTLAVCNKLSVSLVLFEKSYLPRHQYPTINVKYCKFCFTNLDPKKLLTVF